MIAPLDVFALRHGEPEWIGCAAALAEALKLALALGDGNYVVFSQHTGHKNFYKVTAGHAVEMSPGDSGTIA